MGGIDRLHNSLQQGQSATGTPEADTLLRENPNALLIAVLLDQQVQAELAFEGPHKIRERIGHLDMAKMAEMPLEELKTVFGEKPAVHRFYNKMAGTVHEVAGVIADTYDGNAARLWEDAASWDEAAERLHELPGVGQSKVETLHKALRVFGHAVPE
jgi:uncharacterized HhH-GPD family protein